ncbi:MAG: Holliday junction branch migration protein RuvA [Anaerolineales bacterium]|nr:MAG: Holliday junction branch migration protein RuvA [Anaerolineales bacterium]
MIARLSGTVWAIGDDHVVVRSDGIGFLVRTPTTVLDQLEGPGKPIELFTHLRVRENDLSLYGFLTEEELSNFRLLLSVSGVGPKVALAVLSTTTPQDLRQAVGREEPAILARVPGIGKKTAQAIIFQLKDKISLPEELHLPLLSDSDAEVITALRGLGFSLVEAQAALQSLPREDELPIEERVRRALAYFVTP